MLERENGQIKLETELAKPTPYVVSEDINLLLGNWAEERGFIMPKEEFFDEFRAAFKDTMSRVFDSFELVPERELSEGMTDIVNRSGLLPVSFDRVYFRTEPGLEITRLVDEAGQDKGLGRRADNPALLKQFRRLREGGIKEVILVDDVIFTGDMIRRAGNLIERMGVKVPVVCAGIGISEGIEQLNGFGQEVRCVREYEQVVDEICERDFYPGIPMCGRSLEGNENVGVPYILPFGNPGKWASIPVEWQEPLSRFCIQQTIKLFEEVEQASGKPIRCQDLERKMFLLPRDETRFVTALERLL